jgi:hypothetical protein
MNTYYFMGRNIIFDFTSKRRAAIIKRTYYIVANYSSRVLLSKKTIMTTNLKDLNS